MSKVVETPLVEGDDTYSVFSTTMELLCVKSENQYTQKSYDGDCAYNKKYFLLANNAVENCYTA